MMQQDFYINSLKGQYLIAKPGMEDPRFAKSVIYICSHTMQGAMGIVVNNPLKTLSFNDILQQLNIPSNISANIYKTNPKGLFLGGPVETSRGLVLHSSDYAKDTTVPITDTTRLTATIEVLRDISEHKGPREYIVALGFASWAPGQLEDELCTNTWLNLQANDDLIFKVDVGKRWDNALSMLRIDPARYSPFSGTA